MKAGGVLVDDAPIRELRDAVLRSAGFDVLMAASAEAALEHLRGSVAPVAIVDWSLPGMSGPGFIRKLRQDNRTASMCTSASTDRPE